MSLLNIDPLIFISVNQYSNFEFLNYFTDDSLIQIYSFLSYLYEHRIL